MKGSMLFNKDINIEVDVDPSAEEGARLISAKNLVDGQETGGSGGERGANPVNLTWVDLPESFDSETVLACIILTKTEDGYENNDCDCSSNVGGWDGEWILSPQVLAYPTKAEVGEYAFVISQAYDPTHKIVVKAGDADDSDHDFLEVYGDCTLSIEAVE